jgi:hypothetical protein
MGSLFTTSADNKISLGMGRKQNVPFYLQFVPGNVVDVVTSAKSMFFNGPKSINSILALAHISKEPMNLRFSVSEKNRYYPLFRGMVDVPAKGDPVLLCTVGGRNYYLGPLNTTNQPNWNVDTLKNDEAFFSGKHRTLADIIKKNEEGKSDIEKQGESLNFYKNYYNRMSKDINPNLDFKWVKNDTGEKEPYKENGEVAVPPNNSITETHGDLMFEGRHGNSIRVGSRYVNPYIFISNGRNPSNNMETFLDGSILSITGKGSIRQHFPPTAGSIPDPEADSGDTSSDDFIAQFGNQLLRFNLSSDSLLNNRRTMGNMIYFCNIDTNRPIEELVYNYSEHQMLFASERITINSRVDDIYLSSIKDVHIGSGRHTTISTNKDLFIESRNIYLGKPTNYIKRDESGVCSDNEEVFCIQDADCINMGAGFCKGTQMDTVERTMEPMVLGVQLLDVLNDLIDCLSTSCYITPAGAPAPIIDATSAQIANKDNPAVGRKSLKSIQGELQKIVSNYHYIEPNVELTKDPPTEEGETTE